MSANAGQATTLREQELVAVRHADPRTPSDFWAVDGPRQQMLAQAKLFIETNIGDRYLTPAAIADGIFISTRYLYVVFEQESVSVSRYVLSRRLAIGRDLLREDRWAHQTVGEIAARLGFKDPSHFARVFKARFGLTPSVYRRAQLDGSCN